MSSPESISSSSSHESSRQIPQHSHRRHVNSQPFRRSGMSRDSASQRPLPEPPLPRLPSTNAGSDHSGQMLAGILQRPLPSPLSSAEQTAAERRRSIIALDRKRRLTNPASYEETRRRTNSGGWNDRRPSHNASHMDGPSSPRRHASSDANLNRPLPEVIDLTASSPPPSEPQSPLPRRPSRNSSDSNRRYVVPRWQPDADVNECPICQRAFTWLFRRHHCRKCGRVVCNDCSPHRITIPRQFMVNPPGPDIYASSADPVSRRESVGSSEDELYGGSRSPRRRNSAFQVDGGEKVRLCNPCVPDPQPDPFPNYPPLIPDRPGRGPSWDAGAHPSLGIGLPMSSDNRPRAFSARMGQPSIAGSNPYLHQHHRSMGSAQAINAANEPRSQGLTLFGSYREQSSPSRYRQHVSSNAMNPPPFITPSTRVCIS